MNLDGIWSGVAHWADGGKLEVVDGIPPGAPMPDAIGTPSQFAPEFDPSEVFKIAQKLMKKA
jgi:hypothetical protein